VGDGEDADAALGTAGFADELMAAALVGVGYGGVYDLDKLLGHLSLPESHRAFLRRYSRHADGTRGNSL
jgi:hypothetical protein